MFDSLDKLTARRVYVAGKCIARNGAMIEPIVDTPLTLPPGYCACACRR